MRRHHSPRGLYIQHTPRSRPSTTPLITLQIFNLIMVAVISSPFDGAKLTNYRPDHGGLKPTTTWLKIQARTRLIPLLTTPSSPARADPVEPPEPAEKHEARPGDPKHAPDIEKTALRFRTPRADEFSRTYTFHVLLRHLSIDARIQAPLSSGQEADRGLRTRTCLEQWWRRSLSWLLRDLRRG